jgi:hypothetical protein
LFSVQYELNFKVPSGRSEEFKTVRILDCGAAVSPQWCWLSA